jgi:hypothetical protein
MDAESSLRNFVLTKRKSILIFHPHEFLDLNTEDIGRHNSGEAPYGEWTT